MVNNLYAEQYRVASARCRGWDYTGQGSYFVTICTRDRVPWFGRVHNGFVCVSDMGSVIWDCWNSIPDHYQHVRTDAFIVMPDHIHGIIRLGNIRDAYERHHLGVIINTFKGACTRIIRHRIGTYFAWQPRYHDHIIRNAGEMKRIRRYIWNNPRAWDKDVGSP